VAAVDPNIRQGPRLCESSVRHGRAGNDVLPLEQMQYFVLMLAATGGLLRKLFSSESRNWSFHTASVEIDLASAKG
jgi:hypothetical protein